MACRQCCPVWTKQVGGRRQRSVLVICDVRDSGANSHFRSFLRFNESQTFYCTQEKGGWVDRQRVCFDAIVLNTHNDFGACKCTFKTKTHCFPMLDGRNVAMKARQSSTISAIFLRKRSSPVSHGLLTVDGVLPSVLQFHSEPSQCLWENDMIPLDLCCVG